MNPCIFQKKVVILSALFLYETMKIHLQMNDQQIVDCLISRDEGVTAQFFFKDCRPLFTSIVHNVFDNKIDYDELISEFYLHLMENDAHRLRQFEGRSSIFQWMKVVAIRFFLEKRDQVIEKDSEEHLLEQASNSEIIETESQWTAKMDVERLLSQIPNQRYAYVIRKLILEEIPPQKLAIELGVTVDNLYNIKKRAMEALTTIALKDIKKL